MAWDSEAAGEYARIRALLENDGSPMGNLDLMIAAQAVAADGASLGTGGADSVVSG